MDAEDSEKDQSNILQKKGRTTVDMKLVKNEEKLSKKNQISKSSSRCAYTHLQAYICALSPSVVRLRSVQK